MPGKSELADRIAARGWSRAAASTAVDAVLDEITAALVAGERVTLTGFGTFDSAPRAARTARNPRTGESIDVPATTVARFHVGATLRGRVASGSVEALGALPAGPPALRAAAVAPPAAAPAKAVAKPAARPAAKAAAKPAAKVVAKPAAKLAAKAATKPAAKAAAKPAKKADSKAASKVDKKSVKSAKKSDAKGGKKGKKK